MTDDRGGEGGRGSSRLLLVLGIGVVSAAAVVGAVFVGMSAGTPPDPPAPPDSPRATPTTGIHETPTPAPSVTPTPAPPVTTEAPAPAPPPPAPGARTYPWHTGIVATTFWVGEIFDPTAEDGSQEYSTYDSDWLASYGGCDGLVIDGGCETEARTAEHDFFPTGMQPLENPFYLDLPFDDLNDPVGFAMRGEVVPWAGDPEYATAVEDPDRSLMKNRWVRLRSGDRVCYGQIQDAGPGEYHDAEYVFGSDDARPANARYNGAGLDVSPALNGCLGFAELDGEDDLVDWQFVEADGVPDGPWSRIVTVSGVR